MPSATRFQILRGTTAQRTAMTPLISELIYDSTSKTVFIGDGVTAGGISVASGTAITQLTGEVTAGPGPGSVVATVSNAAVIAKVLTGFVAGAGTVSATDTILSAFQKVVGNAITSLVGEATGSGSGAITVTLTNSAVIGKVLTGFSATTGAIAATDTVLQAFNKIGGTIITSLTGEATGTGPGATTVTLSNAAVIGKVLTGYVSGAGTVAATDTILQAIQKLNGNIVALGSPITALTGEVTATGPGSVAATVSNAAVIAKVLTGFVATPGTVTAADSILTAIQKLAAATAAQIVRSTQSTNYTILSTDLTKLIDFTGGSASTFSFTAAATLGNGWYCYIQHSGGNVDLTLDPNGAELIDGVATYVIHPGDARLVICDGVGFNTVSIEGGYREFTAAGANTFNIPAETKIVVVEIWGAGGGGGSGRRDAGATARGGGSGGGGGAYVYKEFRASDLGTSVTITIGTGGTGGAGQTVNSTDGNVGVAGGNTTFGTFLTAYGGGGGLGGNATTNSGGGGGGILSAGAGAAGGAPAGTGFGGASGNPGAIGSPSGWGGASGGGSNATSTTFAGGCSGIGGPGGGGGGGVTTGNAGQAAGAGGSSVGASGGGGAGGAAGVAGTAGTAGPTAIGPGTGGGGGGGSTTTPGVGGAGGIAAGGGGGGGTANGVTSGAGAAGGNGYCRISYR